MRFLRGETIRDVVGLDFETFCEADLPTVGLHNYINHKSFEPLIAHVSVPHENGFYITKFDFVERGAQRKAEFIEFIRGLVDEDVYIAAHNAAFEWAVLKRMGLDLPYSRFIDTAVLASERGAGRSLEAAAEQLIGIPKLQSGKNLIKLFSIPHDKFGGKRITKAWLGEDSPVLADWEEFNRYCARDSLLSVRIANSSGYRSDLAEKIYSNVTFNMNQRGWKVDLESVQLMQDRYMQNIADAELVFRRLYDPKGGLNLNSLKQLKEWCAKRGVRAKSFNEESVTRLIKALSNKLQKMSPTDSHYDDYTEVLAMLNTKQIIGGSSLKKLQVILDQTASDGRLKDQYLHLGASQTFRTTGRGVQMQNLKRLSSPRDLETLKDPGAEWTNDDMADNLRQLFTASGAPESSALIVGDFSSVESRGLAWLANASWKLKEYEAGKDLYKVLATKMYPVQYEDVTSEQRKAGKVGELSCGYGAGPGAVQSFANGMGIEMSEGEALQIVRDWREANPEVVELWGALDQMLHDIHQGDRVLTVGPPGTLGVTPQFELFAQTVETPESLQEIHPGAQSIEFSLMTREPQGSSKTLFRRIFHGTYMRGRNLCYYKPTARKTGEPWVASFIDPKTKSKRYYDIYGGKLAGILTQSLCREIFFDSLNRVENSFANAVGYRVIGQFHDEIVVDVDAAEALWGNPAAPHELFEHAAKTLKACMSDAQIKQVALPDFPLEAEVNWAWRYIK